MTTAPQTITGEFTVLFKKRDEAVEAQGAEEKIVYCDILGQCAEIAEFSKAAALAVPLQEQAVYTRG